MIWNIEPLVGMGPLRFGMHVRDVAKILDGTYPVTDRRIMFDGSTNEYRGPVVPVCSYQKDVLRGIDTNSNVQNVFIDQIDVYQTKPRDAVSLLYKKNGGAKYGVGILLFDHISLSTSGFFVKGRGFYLNGYDDGQDERTLGAYVGHAFDPLLSEFRDVKLGASPN